MKKTTNALIIIATIGIVLGLYLTYSFYSNSIPVCDISQNISCDKLTKGDYATVLGIPIAVMGVLWFVLIFLLAYQTNKNPKNAIYLLLLSISGLIFMLYLIGIEIALKTICLWCTAVHILILFNFFISLKIYRKSRV